MPSSYLLSMWSDERVDLRSVRLSIMENTGKISYFLSNTDLPLSTFTKYVVEMSSIVFNRRMIGFLTGLLHTQKSSLQESSLPYVDNLSRHQSSLSQLLPLDQESLNLFTIRSGGSESSGAGQGEITSTNRRDKVYLKACPKMESETQILKVLLTLLRLKKVKN